MTGPNTLQHLTESFGFLGNRMRLFARDEQFRRLRYTVDPHHIGLITGGRRRTGRLLT